MNGTGNLIAGDMAWSGKVIETRNPSDLSDTVGVYAEGTHETAADAVAAARHAFAKWGLSGPQKRFDMLDTAGNRLLAERDAIALLLAREEGKTLAEAAGEVTRAAMVFKFFAGEALRPGGELLPSVRDGLTVEITREPVGVVGLITPWNFPIAIPAWKIAAALAFGNTIVIKPSEVAPGCAHELARILGEAGVPAGVINLVVGSGPVVGKALVDSADVDAISFTGSVRVGRQIGADCGVSGKRVQLEMGGKNPLVVIDDADLNVAVEVAVNGSFFQTGQRCTASSRLIVTEGIFGRFIEAVKARMDTLRIGHALHHETQIGPVVSERQLEQNQRYLSIARSEGGEIHGGQMLERATKGYFMAPALITGTTSNMRVNREEIFGPVASVIRVKDYDEALAVANDTEFGLSSGICTTSLKYAQHFRRHVQSGLVMVNTPTAGLDYHVPFGGRKGSSYGPREQGAYAREFYSVVKTAYVSA
ncbi:aldehyde dehydrogenase family protein [Burkholderia sp. WAC0059]|uniref:aldehyde dehydrogenase family protein n=1 Tax=Burkholderia sp. WAC0059 TaxID=2066022 RepID=UPI0026B09337